MYIESKATGLTGEARIGRVSFSKTGRTLYYRGRAFQSLRGSGFKANYYDVATGGNVNPIWPRRDGLIWPHLGARCGGAGRRQ